LKEKTPSDTDAGGCTIELKNRKTKYDILDIKRIWTVRRLTRKLD